MKKKVCLLWIMLSAMACSENVTPQYGPDEPLSVNVFYDQLGPYGAWVNYAPYGFVWIPDVPIGFQPYFTNGYWLYSSYGWTWYSYYAWGWAPFHYGRWYFDMMYGWMWVPDTIWGPGWVAWRMGGGYCGWAPLGPNISVTVVINGTHKIPHDHWIFVNDKDFTNRHIDRYRIDRSRNSLLMNDATLLNQTREDRQVIYQPGPDKDHIQRATNRPIDTYEISKSNKPGRPNISNNRVEMYKPEMKHEMDPSPPKRTYNLNDINKQTERSTTPRQRQTNPGLWKQQPQPNMQPVRPRTTTPARPAPTPTPRPRKRGN